MPHSDDVDSYTLSGKFLINRTTSSGIILVILGIVAAILGVATFANQSVACFVTPGPFPPCIASYQVPLLAPLYPLSAWLIVLGSLLSVLGVFFATLGHQKGGGDQTHEMSKIGQDPNQSN